MARPSAALLALLAALLLVAAAPAAQACTDDDDGQDDDCPGGCATGEVVIPSGQRCGGDRNGCCQSTNIGNVQNQYPSCKNPNPANKPAYCTSSVKPNNYWTPWNCDSFRCAAGNICVCNTGDCTCTTKSNFNNIKNNGKGYSPAACGDTFFGGYARAHGIDGGDYTCQNR